MARVIQELQIDGGAGPFSVANLVQYALRSDVRFNSNFEGIGKALRIAQAVPADNKASSFQLEEGDWLTVCDALRSPSPLAGMGPYPLVPGHACVPLIDRVLTAEPAPKDPPP